ncbi:uncharacterized protein LOC142625188 [Castanea sativa]|uniref:uncharacterized protein LOC142625188 n=1 Tax=Castanea sativa TaxID=21020 RepID=UPI003F64E9F7
MSYSILVNGEPKGLIKPSRGLRQGDPHSLYLFLFCAEGLNAILRRAALNGEIQGFSLCRNCPRITYIFFSNDCLWFCRSTLEECEKIQELLSFYEAASEQMLNKKKTTLFFSRNTDEQMKEAIKSFLNVLAIQHYEKYLGLPSFVGRAKKECFTHLKEKIWARMEGWKEKLLSQAGKEVMIKAVVQSIPTYSMSVFKIPVGLCKDIEAMIRKFWWGQGDSKKIHWVKWSTLSSSKTVGAKGRVISPKLTSKSIWKIRTLNKIRHFIWRATRDSLPTKQNLKARHLPVEETCALCGDFQETLMHSIWLCEQAQAVWKFEISFVPYYRNGFRSFFDLLEEVLRKGSGYHVALFSTIAWSLWQRRNRLRENQSARPLHEIGDRAKALVVEFLEPNKQDVRLRIGSILARWVPPQDMFYKANYDAAIFDNSSSAGLGVVIRDCHGHVIAALSQKIPLPNSIEAVEALVALQAIVFAKELCIFKVVVEGDYLRVVQALKAKERCYTLHGNIIEDARNQSLSLQFCQFQHVRRDGSKLAHVLAW